MREDVDTWDQCFMGMARKASRRSKDPDTRHGACIVDKDKRIVSVGYNGLPQGFNDEGTCVCLDCSLQICLPEHAKYNEMSLVGDKPWTIDYWQKPDKYKYVIHAEDNAMKFADKERMKGGTLYLYSEKGYFPCENCSLDMVTYGIKEVVLKEICEDEVSVYNFNYSKHILHMGNIEIRLMEDELD